MWTITTDATIQSNPTRGDDVIVLPRRATKHTTQQKGQTNKKKRLLVRPLAVNDFLERWCRLAPGTHVVAIHGPRGLDNAPVVAATAGRLLRPRLHVDVLEVAGVPHGAQLLVEVARRLREKDGSDPERMQRVLRQVWQEMEVWVSKPAAGGSSLLARLLRRVRRSHWYYYNKTGRSLVRVEGSNLVETIEATLQGGAYALYATGYPSLKPVTSVVERLKKHQYIRRAEVERMRLQYDGISKVLIITCLPTKKRIERLIESQ